MMRQLSLKVLLSVFLLIFSASIGLSAVYECKFYWAAALQSWQVEVLILPQLQVDTRQNKVQILSGAKYKSKVSNQPYEAKVSNSSLTFGGVSAI